MKNISRVLLKKKSKQNDRRKNSSVSSVPDNITSPASGQLTASLSATSGWKPQESPTHHIVHVQTPPRRENGPLYINQTQEAWTAKQTNVPCNSLNSPSTVGLIPKVNIGLSDDVPRYREDVISITKDVQRFLATITELRQAMEEMDVQKPEFTVHILDNDQEDSNLVDIDDENKELMTDTETEEYYRSQDKVIEKLRELVQVVEICLESNPGMQSTVLTRTSKHLLATYENCTHDMGKVSECIPCNNAIDSLVDTFTQNVSDYMIGETSDPAGGITTLGSMGGAKAKPQSLGIPQLKGPASSKSHDNLARFSSSVDLTQANEPIVDIIDQDLLNVENNVEIVSGYIKFRQKYARELVGYLSKRAQLEQRHYAQLAKIVRQTQTALTELHQQEECLPLIDVLRKSLDDDSHYAMNSNTTFNLQVGHKILEPLEHKILESEKMRKDLMQNWQRERKKLAEAKALMKNTKAKYHFYGSEISRVKNLLAAEPFGKQADRKKKEISELEGKFQEAEQAFKDAVAHCNDCQYQVHATAQKSILCAFRRIIIGFDTALKAGLENYFQLQYNFFKSLPEPLVINLEEAQDYEIGSEFLSFIQRQKHVCDELEDYHFEEFDPEAENLWDNAEEGGPESSSSAILFSTSADNKSPHDRTLSPTWDIKGGIQAAFLRNETPSPKPSQKIRPKSIAILDINPVTDSPKTNLQRRNSEKKDIGTTAAITISQHSSTDRSNTTEDTVYSRMAKTHGFRKLRTPSRCKGCDTYVYFHGFECETCGLACHRKCLATLAIRCGTKKLPRKMNTFGVDFHEHLKATKRHIPIIVTKCINEIDERGLDTQGLYRISSAKSKMEKLCQLFEVGSERVDLSDLPPHLISSCLKLYFRQLPEPLLTFGLYQEFLTFAREASLVLPCKLDKLNKEQYDKAYTLLKRLKELIHRLPESNQLTLARLMYHLHRVSSPEHVRVNCMPPSNIGIVFGPNLLRQQEMLPSLALLANMSYQAKAVEIMTAHALDIFHIPEEDIKQFELECSEEDDMEAINERLVDELEEYQETSIDIDDDEESKSNVVYNRTPMSTPPERRKMNVEELHDMLEEFGSGQSNFLTPPHPKGVSQPMPFFASPLLHDSRNWQDHSRSEFLPGSTEGFAESVFNSIDRRLLHPYHAVSVPAMEKILTPVMEKEDYATDEEFDEPIMYSACNTLDYHHTRRRAQSLTKSSSTGFNEDDDKGDSDAVFHSRTPSNVSDASRRAYLGSRSEDNLLQIDNLDSPVVKEPQRLSFESNILKYVQEENDERCSTESLDSQEYKPFQSPDVQALLLPSSTESSPGLFPRSVEGKPVQSLPRNFHRPPVPSLPLRQMSEGYIKPIKSPRFSVGSPPLASPISLISADKSGSSRGSFSEHFLYDSAELDEHKVGKKEMMLKKTRGDRNVEYEGRGDKSSQLVIRHQRGREKTADSGIEDPPNFNSVASVEEEDIPLPDNSPMIGVPKFPPTHRFSTSRDSGLSDSPDPFVEIASPSHTLSSKVLVDKLSQIVTDQTKHPSPLIKEQKTTTKKEATPTNNRAPFSKSQSTAVSPKTRVTHHIMKVMKASSLDFDPSSPFQFSENDSTLPEQRLRMVSPDRLISPTDYSTDIWNMKRSKSLAEGTAFAHNSEETEEEHTRMGELIISEAKIGQQKISSQGFKKGMDRDLSKSLEILR